MPRLRRSLLSGLAIVGMYLAAAGLSFRSGLLPAVPLLDGLGPPPPYQWVKPPPDRVRDNRSPSAGQGAVPLTAFGSSGSVTTPEGQAQLLLDNNSVPALAGQSSLKVTLDPLDPATVGPPPSGGFQYDSNAYKIEALYEPSNQPVTALTAVVVLRFATAADQIIRWNGSSWDALASTATRDQLFSTTDKLGIFATAGRNTGRKGAQSSPVKSVLEIFGIFAIMVAIFVAVIARTAVRERRGKSNKGPGARRRRSVRG